MDENINLLNKIGLTMYESQAYLALTLLISANAVEIAEKAEIPRSKIYGVLKRLNEEIGRASCRERV